MPEDAIRRAAGRSWAQVAPAVAIAAAVVGVFCPWTRDGSVTLDGTEGPHDGWLVVVLAVPAVFWARSMARGSWVGVVGVVGTALVMAWTVLTSWRDSREVLGAGIGYGVALVLAASVVLVAAAVGRGLELLRLRRTAASRS